MRGLSRVLALVAVCFGSACVGAPVVLPDAQTTARHAGPPESGSPAEQCTDRTRVDVLHQAVDLSLRLDPPSLSGRGELRLRARRETSIVALDARNLRVTEVATASGANPFFVVGDRLCVQLARAVSPGTEFTMKLAWNVPTTSETPRFSTNEAWAGYNASSWMPTLQDPAQRATLALRVTTTAALKVAASGRKIAASPAGDGLVMHSFSLDRPSPTFLYAFAVGRFDEADLDVDGVKLRALGPEGANLKNALAITAPMLRFLADRTGVPFSGDEYVQVFVHDDIVAQEAASLSLLSANALEEVRKDPKEDWIFAHELAHQWFAWLVPCVDFADFWLNEGFATFLVAAMKEQTWGRAEYEREVALWRTRSAKVHAAGRDAPLSLSRPGATPKAPLTDADLQPRGVTYARGALVLHKLRDELGDKAFWDGIRRYTRDRAGKGARSEDLRVSLETASGRDLNEWFEKWVYAAAPDL